METFKLLSIHLATPLGWIVFCLTLVPVYVAHRALRKKPWPRKLGRQVWRVTEYVLLWCIPVLGFVAQKGSEWAGDKQTGEIVTISNRLSQAQGTIRTLETGRLPRTITPEQRDIFLAAVKDAPKAPVWILCGDSTTDTYDFSRLTRQLLDDSGYGVGSFPVGSLSTSGRVDGVSMIPGIYKVFTPPATLRTNFAIVLMISDTDITNAPPAVLGFCKAFSSSKINAGILFMTGQPSGAIGIFIPSKFGS